MPFNNIATKTNPNVYAIKEHTIYALSLVIFKFKYMCLTSERLFQKKSSNRCTKLAKKKLFGMCSLDKTI